MKKNWLRKRYLYIVFILALVVLEVTKVTSIFSDITNLYLNTYSNLNEGKITQNALKKVLPIFSKDIQNFFSSSLNSETKNFNTLAEVNQLKRKIKKLEENLAIQKYLAQEAFFLKKENNILKRQINYTKTSQNLVISAKVILIDPQNHFISLWINKGVKQKIKVGQAVITYQNNTRSLVGFIKEVYKSTSLIQTIKDQQSHVSVVIGDTESKAIVQGLSRFNPHLKMNYLDINLTNLINRPVYTSGLGEKFPAGIKVGVITEVFNKNYGLFKDASVKPTVNFFTISDVLVVLKKIKK